MWRIENMSVPRFEFLSVLADVEGDGLSIESEVEFNRLSAEGWEIKGTIEVAKGRIVLLQRLVMT